MSDQTDFLLARIAEDETAARKPLAMDRPHAAGCEYAVAADHFTPECDCNMSARVLARCEADRKIVQLAIDNDEFSDPYETEKVWEVVLPVMAAAYRDHPDYCEPGQWPDEVAEREERAARRREQEAARRAALGPLERRGNRVIRGQSPES